MTALSIQSSSAAPSTAPAARAGRVLAALMGLFLGLDGLMRIAGRSLVPASEQAPSLDPGAQTVVGLILVAGAAMSLARLARAAAPILLLAGLGAVVATELAAPVRSTEHLLFWVYLAGLTVAGHVLGARRKASASERSTS